MTKGLTTRIKEKLRDPIWQSIGVFLTFIALLSSLVVGNLIFRPRPSESNRLIFSSETSKELTDISEPVSKRMQILIDGKEERGLRLFVFRLQYKGQLPVRPSDFEEPIKGQIPNNRKLLNVQKSSNPEAPREFDKATETFVANPHPPVNFEATLIDEHNFEIKPLLMNPGEWLLIEIYTAAADPNGYSAPKDSTESYKELSSEVTWTCHAANVECPASLDLQRDFDYMDFNEPSFLQVYVMHTGWSVYFIVLFTILNLIVLVLLGRTAGLSDRPPATQLILFSLAIASSISSAEILADWLLPYHVFGIRLHDSQPAFAWLIFAVNITIIVWMAVISIRKRRTTRRKRPLKSKA
jgi:hypothetical protein